MTNAIAFIPGLFASAGRGLQSLGRRALNIEPGHAYGYSLGSPVLSGVTVTPQTALTLAPFFCGVDVISTDVAKLPFALYRESRGGSKRAKNDPRNRLVSRKPNPLMNAMRYRQMQMGHVLGWGGHYSEIRRDFDGNPASLWPLHPGTTKPYVDPQSKRFYYRDVNTGKTYAAEDVIHIAGLGFDGLSGYTIPTVGRQAIGLGIGSEQFGASLFGNGARPGGFLKLAKKLTDPAAKRLIDTFNYRHGGTQNAHGIGILEEGMEWVEAQISPENAQFLLTRQFQVVEIARLLKIPPHKLQDYSAAHLANVEEANLDYLTSTLQGWLEAIEAEYNSKLLFDDELEAFAFRHDMNALMRGNMTARSTYYKNRFQVGSMSPNEVRRAEGENPVKGPNADKCYLQMQYVPLDLAGQAAAAGKVPPAPTNPEDPEKSAEKDQEETP